jgi:head-tail adaptor
MQAGKLNSRITVKKFNRVSDEFGGYNNTAASEFTFWGHIERLSGDIEQENGKRSLSLELKITARKKAINGLNVGDVLIISNEEYRLNSKIDTVEDFYTELKATKKS